MYNRYLTRPTESRRRKGRCPGCLKPVYRGGIRHAGRFWHERCFRESKPQRRKVES